LQKTPQEFEILVVDRNHDNWAVVADKAYLGPENDTPGIRRITPHKGRNLPPARRLENDEINRIRVPIEQFFGRQYKLWGFSREVYRYVVMDVCF